MNAAPVPAPPAGAVELEVVAVELVAGVELVVEGGTEESSLER